MQSYVALYKNKRIEVEASSSFEAQQAAAKLFNAKIYHVQIVPVDELAMLRQCDQLSSPVTKQDVSGPVDARGKRFKLGQEVARRTAHGFSRLRPAALAFFRATG